MINLKETERKIINNLKVEKDEITYFLEKQSLSFLIEFANDIKKIYKKNYIHLCCAISIKTNGCLQNCRYCAQSRFWPTKPKNFGYETPENILQFAKLNNDHDIKFIGLNSATGYFDELDKKKLKKAYDIIIKNTNLKICAAHGILKNFEEAKTVKQLGAYNYEHNIQTSRSFFKNICTTHTYDEKIETIKYAKKAGLKICSGVIIGMGETFKDVIDMAMTLKELNVKSVPINILTPAYGTPFYNKSIKITKKEVLRDFATFRIILKDADIIFGAGRNFMGKYINICFYSGLNGIVVGDMLTHKGEKIIKDINTINSAYFS